MVEKLVQTGMKRETAQNIVSQIEKGYFPTGLNLTIHQYFIIGWF